MQGKQSLFSISPLSTPSIPCLRPQIVSNSFFLQRATTRITLHHGKHFTTIPYFASRIFSWSCRPDHKFTTFLSLSVSRVTSSHFDIAAALQNLRVCISLGGSWISPCPLVWINWNKSSFYSLHILTPRLVREPVCTMPTKVWRGLFNLSVTIARLRGFSIAKLAPLGLI